MSRCTSSVTSRDEECGDAEKVVGELGVVIGARLVTENHEFDVSLRKDPLDELDTEATKSVAVEHHDLADFAAVNAFQKGLQPAAFPVEARADVLDDLARFWGDGVAESVDLALEVGTLLGAADASIENFRFRRMTRVLAEEVVEVGGGVEALAMLMRLDRTNFTFKRPSPEGTAGDCIAS
jgi:hypothetical protein